MGEQRRIGVTGNSRRFAPSWVCTRLAVRLAGARAVRISVRHNPEPAPLDGLIIGGGDDISPEHYGGDLTARVKPDPERDRLEIRWIEWALERDIPMLGICRGEQLINVVLGGNLHQDIRPIRYHTYNRPTLLPRKKVLLQADSRVTEICGKSELRVNSLHSQAISDPAATLRVVGRDLDGIIQAVEANDSRVIVGVQWHPEYLIYLPSQLALFRWLCQC